mgnify:CR=1 FL=1
MKKILIVDDQAITLKMTSHILSTEYKTFCATSGAEAIEIFKREGPDLVLSDLNMPQMSGFELQNRLQEMYVDTIPIMFMTADSSDDTESRGFENGAVDYIRKPFRADVLLRRVANILKNIEKIQTLKQTAETDPMTGLLNKASSQHEISEMCRKTPGVLMMIDLDSFKLVNDLYGHAMGDKILIRFAEIIKSAIRSSDIAGRMGGDEFIAYCQHVDDEEVIAEKTRYINEELLISAREYMGEDMTIPLGASIGAVSVPSEGTEFLTLFTKADKALYEVKQNGKHGYALYHEQLCSSTDEESVETGIQNEIAILKERNRGKGALNLPDEQYRLIYRFLARAEINYHHENRIALLSLRGADGELPATDEPGEKLLEIICGSLRASDVVTQRSRNTISVILLEASPMDTNMIMERIVSKWNEIGMDYDISYEVELIG